MGFSAVTSMSAWIPNASCVFVDRNSGTTPSGRARKIESMQSVFDLTFH